MPAPRYHVATINQLSNAKIQIFRKRASVEYKKSSKSFPSVSPQQRPNPLAVEPRDVLPFDEFRALGLAGVGVGAVAKA